MSCGKVNGLEEANLCKREECKTSCELTQVVYVEKYKETPKSNQRQYLTKLIFQLRDTVAHQEMRIQILENQVKYLCIISHLIQI